MLLCGDPERMEKIIWLSKYNKFKVGGSSAKPLYKHDMNQEKVCKKCAEVVHKKEL